MTIRQLEAKLQRLTDQVETAQADLATLKREQRDVKLRLNEARKAAKHGKLPRVEPAVGITDKITTMLSENVAEPIAEMLGLAEQPTAVRVAQQPTARKRVVRKKLLPPADN